MIVPAAKGVWPALLRGVFAFYRVALSPVLHAAGVSRCIYLPTCSEYAQIVLLRHGPVRGAVLAARRIARCNPLAKGGLDPVP